MGNLAGRGDLTLPHYKGAPRHPVFLRTPYSHCPQTSPSPFYTLPLM